MFQFVKRLILFSIVGVFFVAISILLYVILDPFMIIGKYTNYNKSMVALNRDYITTENILDNYKIYNYNSFVFGSSRTIAFRCQTWSNYLPSAAKPVMFDASGESIYGIYTKLKLLDSLDVKIDNALIIVCRDATFSRWDNQTNHLFIKHYRLTGQNPIMYHMVFLRAYFDPKFMYAFFRAKLLGGVQTEMNGILVTDKTYNMPVTNDIVLIDKDLEIDSNADNYYRTNSKLFYKQDRERYDTATRITSNRIKMILDIKNIFTKHGTNYKIIISPLYEQIKFNNEDLETLNNIFGKCNVFDFSGKNEITENMRNYYESSHYRPHVGAAIINSVYKKQ